VGIGSRGAGGVILGRGQHLAEFRGRILPFGLQVRPEGIGDRAPAGVVREQGFFRVGRRAVLGFDALEDADRLDIVGSFLAEAACANPERVGYSEIAGWVWLGVGLRDDGRSGRSSPGKNAQSQVASSQAAW